MGGFGDQMGDLCVCRGASEACGIMGLSDIPDGSFGAGGEGYPEAAVPPGDRSKMRFESGEASEGEEVLGIVVERDMWFLRREWRAGVFGKLWELKMCVSKSVLK